ncbi:YeeE/YedE thiosulfate transporter family protein [Mycolicibacterium chlorophenolicum]|uniref:Putative inner membrane protein n=1 Tax=Mycolicibacterium chlorophenolicum TaxID=37916 RepID=A0A0J6W727_9MYCO|nr:YeeE/YedE thiosulfate transporter family protein [Mycolicibacterium chlorophenolicum]KMO78324.1 putative inner membrane protein [Mycolicibacterium chlorophenolicum]
MTVTAPLWVGVLIGFAFGLPASLWGIGNPETVIRTARLVDRLLVGCFLFVTAIGSVLLYGVHALGIGVHFSPRPIYLFGVTIGGVLFGVGAAVSGYFPGTELIALGEGRRDVLAAIPGGLLGAAAWTALYQTEVGRWLVSTANYGNLVATGDITTIRPWRMFAVAVVYAVLALSLLYYLPRYRGGRHSCFRNLVGPADPHDQSCARDSAEYLAEGSSRGPRRMLQQVTDPNFYARLMSVIALFVAVLVVLSLVLRQPFGLSTTYSWVVGHLAMPDFAYSRDVFATIGWEPFTAAGVLVGALVSASLISGRFTAFRPVLPPSWRNRFGPSRAKRAVGCFAGSFLVLFGARMAGGCTSGHTLSGGIQLSVSAWVFTAAMVAGMVVTARLLYGRTSWLTTAPELLPSV